MAIIKTKQRTNPFVQIDKAGLEDARLTLKAKGLWAYLMSRPPNWKVSVAHLVKTTPDGRTAIYSALKELRTYGYARYSQPFVNGRLAEGEWVITDDPAEIAVNEALYRKEGEILHSENLNTVFLNAEKDYTNNIELNKNDLNNFSNSRKSDFSKNEFLTELPTDIKNQNIQTKGNSASPQNFVNILPQAEMPTYTPTEKDRARHEDFGARFLSQPNTPRVLSDRGVKDNTDLEKEMRLLIDELEVTAQNYAFYPEFARRFIDRLAAKAKIPTAKPTAPQAARKGNILKVSEGISKFPSGAPSWDEVMRIQEQIKNGEI